MNGWRCGRSAGGCRDEIPHRRGPGDGKDSGKKHTDRGKQSKTGGAKRK